MQKMKLQKKKIWMTKTTYLKFKLKKTEIIVSPKVLEDYENLL